MNKNGFIVAREFYDRLRRHVIILHLHWISRGAAGKLYSLADFITRLSVKWA